MTNRVICINGNIVCSQYYLCMNIHSRMHTHAHLLFKERFLCCMYVIMFQLKTFIMLSQIKYIVIMWYSEKFPFFIIAHCIFTIQYILKF